MTTVRLAVLAMMFLAVCSSNPSLTKSLRFFSFSEERHPSRAWLNTGTKSEDRQTPDDWKCRDLDSGGWKWLLKQRIQVEINVKIKVEVEIKVEVKIEVERSWGLKRSGDSGGLWSLDLEISI
ncbi:hypothetical protein C1H46_038356 [Malus baccata]|uniref:Uncharacterized protein n=1 Tax=Malus baccata TaxID=106549 RepID=A0A540KPE0_MALBA|nr:hypothetical protein C1H46_038356 [Malus baccata]